MAVSAVSIAYLLLNNKGGSKDKQKMKPTKCNAKKDILIYKQGFYNSVKIYSTMGF